MVKFFPFFAIFIVFITVKGKDSFLIINKNFNIETSSNSKKLKKISKYFIKTLSKRLKIDKKDEKITKNIICKIVFSNRIKSEEGYKIVIKKDKIVIFSKGEKGGVYALLELQKMLKKIGENYVLPLGVIEEGPAFLWRGLLIDPARHFLKISTIKRVILWMGYMKLNKLHIHLSDDQGFRVESKRYPLLHKKGSDGKYYTQNELKEFIKYGELFNVEIIPEFDIPAHTTSWFLGYPNLSIDKKRYKLEKKWGPKDPVFDPIDNYSYNFLNNFFKEMKTVFRTKYIHIGGDENRKKGWKKDIKVIKFCKKNGIKIDQLHHIFIDKVLKNINKMGKYGIGWDEIFHNNLDKKTVIQIWRGDRFLKKIVKKGYNVITSSPYYIDLFYPIEKHYRSPIPKKLSKKYHKNILGGEIALWGEFVDDTTLDILLWSRGKGIADQFWYKNPPKIDKFIENLPQYSNFLDEIGFKHKKNRVKILKKFVKDDQINSLIQFLDFLTPTQYYDRHRYKKYRVDTPLNDIIDAIGVPIYQLYKFNKSVENFKKDKNHKLILEQLNRVIKNCENLEPLIDKKLFPIRSHLKIVLNLTKILKKMVLIDQKNGEIDPKLIKKFNILLKKGENIGSEIKIAILKYYKKLFKILL